VTIYTLLEIATIFHCQLVEPLLFTFTCGRYSSGGDGKMRGARREVGIVRGEHARIRARNGVISEAVCEAAVGYCAPLGRGVSNRRPASRHRPSTIAHLKYSVCKFI